MFISNKVYMCIFLSDDSVRCHQFWLFFLTFPSLALTCYTVFFIYIHLYTCMYIHICVYVYTVLCNTAGSNTSRTDLVANWCRVLWELGGWLICIMDFLKQLHYHEKPDGTAVQFWVSHHELVNRANLVAQSWTKTGKMENRKKKKKNKQKHNKTNQNYCL